MSLVKLTMEDDGTVSDVPHANTRAKYASTQCRLRLASLNESMPAYG